MFTCHKQRGIFSQSTVGLGSQSNFIEHQLDNDMGIEIKK